jgi:Ulp1 family protease
LNGAVPFKIVFSSLGRQREGDDDDDDDDENDGDDNGESNDEGGSNGSRGGEDEDGGSDDDDRGSGGGEDNDGGSDGDDVGNGGGKANECDVIDLVFTPSHARVSGIADSAHKPMHISTPAANRAAPAEPPSSDLDYLKMLLNTKAFVQAPKPIRSNEYVDSLPNQNQTSAQTMTQQTALWSDSSSSSSGSVSIPGPLLQTIMDEEVDQEPSEEETQQAAEEDLQQRQEELIQKRRANLSPEELATFQSAIEYPSNEVLTEKFNIDMTRTKFRDLRPRTWLNDEIINFYMCLLMERDEKLSDESVNAVRRTSHYFNSFFMCKLLTECGYNYGAVKRWSKKFDVFEKDKIFIPINIRNTHWTLAVVYVLKKEIAYYDSMSGVGRQYLSALLRWLQDEAKEKKGITLDVSDWTLIDSHEGEDVPQQHNGFDCGVFTTICADYISDDLPLVYSQQEMPLNRAKIGAAILRGVIEY